MECEDVFEEAADELDGVCEYESNHDAYLESFFSDEENDPPRRRRKRSTNELVSAVEACTMHYEKAESCDRRRDLNLFEKYMSLVSLPGIVIKLVDEIDCKNY